MISELEFSKQTLRDIELLWLNLHAPDVEITYKFVENYQRMPLYRKGLWSGKAYFVKFDPKDSLVAMNFRVFWWDLDD